MSESTSTRETIFAASVDYFLTPILPFLRDPAVTEIMVNRFDTVYVERAGRLYKTDARFPSEDALVSAIHNVAQWVGRRIDEQQPILDARLPNGSRVHAILPPGCRSGTCVTIRKFKPGGLTLGDLVSYGSITESASEFLQLCVKLHKSMVVSGGTGTGKTSLLNALSAAIPEDERIIVIEDTAELRLRQEHAIYLEVQRPDSQGRGGLSIRQLFVASLRMRPDRILVGEVRGGEALDMIQAMLSGHTGSLTTVHANNTRDALTRLETLSLMSDVELPVYVARSQVASAIQVVVQLSRFSEDGSRRITRISEVSGLGPDQMYVCRDLFALKMQGRGADGRLIGSLEPTGEKPSFASEPAEQGLAGVVKHSAPLWSLTRM